MNIPFLDRLKMTPVHDVAKPIDGHGNHGFVIADRRLAEIEKIE